MKTIMKSTGRENLSTSLNYYPAVTDSLLSELAARVCSVGEPALLVLFGSRARGDFRSDSDIDVLILESDKEGLDEKWKMYSRALGGLYPELTLLVKPLKEAEEWKDVPGYIVTTALREGQVLYQQPAKEHGTSAFAQGTTSVLEDEEPKYKTCLDLARAWFDNGDDDLKTCKLLIEREGPYKQVCFHAQQAAEKYLKGLIAFHGKAIPRTHNLQELAEACTKFVKTDELRDLLDLPLAELSQHGITGRYDLYFHPSAELSQRALEWAIKVVEIVLSQVPE